MKGECRWYEMDDKTARSGEIKTARSPISSMSRNCRFVLFLSRKSVDVATKAVTTRGKNNVTLIVNLQATIADAAGGQAQVTFLADSVQVHHLPAPR